MQNAVAFANNDVITVAWSFGQKLERCMGFAVYRVDADGKEMALPAVAVFPGFKRASGDTCEKFPIQKFYWKDVYARLVAETTGQRTFRYKIVPLEGVPGKLVPMPNPQITSNEVEITARLSDGIHAYFNRGLISTQRISRAFQGKPSKKGLLDRIENPTDALRVSLSGDMVEALTDFVARAKSGGKLYAALYELRDLELVPLLEKAGKRLSIVLSNALEQEVRPEGAPTSPPVPLDGNQDARDRLTKTAEAMFSRLLPSNQIGHNKFVVYVDKSGHARAVLFGSTNWTPTGLCAQTNNTVVIDNAKVAQRYLDYWKKLKADSQQAKDDPKALQAAGLRTWDATAKTISLGADGTLTSWFSPNTPKLRSSSTKHEQRPPDMADVFAAIQAAKRAVLFLVFYPGSPNVAQWAADAQKANKDLFVRGCVTDPSASESFYYELHGTTPPLGREGAGQPRNRRRRPRRLLRSRGLDEGDPERRLRHHPRQGRGDRSVLPRVRGHHGQPQPRPQGLVQQRREPRHHPRQPQARRGLRVPRPRRVRPLRLAGGPERSTAERRRLPQGEAGRLAGEVLQRRRLDSRRPAAILAERALLKTSEGGPPFRTPPEKRVARALPALEAKQRLGSGAGQV